MHTYVSIQLYWTQSNKYTKRTYKIEKKLKWRGGGGAPQLSAGETHLMFHKKQQIHTLTQSKQINQLGNHKWPI